MMNTQELIETPPNAMAETGGMTAIHDAIKRGYEHGFTTDIETESFAKGLSEAVVRAISAKKTSLNG